MGTLAGAVITLRQLIHAAQTPSIDFVHVWSATHQMIGSGGAYGDPLFTYPPGASLLLWPFGLVSYSTGQVAMLAVNVSAIAIAAVLLTHELVPRIRPSHLGLLLLPIGGLDAVASTWANGNINGVLLLLEVLAIRWLLRRQPTPAAIALGLSLALKPVLLPLLLLFVVRRHWRALGIAVALPVLLNLAGLLVVSDAKRYLTVVLPYLMHGAQLPFNDSLVGLGYRCGLPAAAVAVLRLTVALCAVGLYAWTATRPSRLDARGRLFAEITIGLTTTFLVSPMSETYYTLFLVPALAWLATTSRRTAAGVALLSILCFATLRLTGVPDDVHRSVSVLALRPTFGWLALLGVIAGLLLADRRPPPRLQVVAPDRREPLPLQPV